MTINTKLVVDSALNLPRTLLKDLDISVVPVSVSIDEKTFREDVDATREELVGLIGAAKQASTSQPAPGDFIEVYNSLGDAQVVSIHITGKLSGTLQTAQMAAEMVDSGRIFAVDSENASMGGGWLAVAAAQALRQGKTTTEIIDLLHEIRPMMGTCLSMPSLKYLQKSGRVNLAKALMASLLSVKPIFTFKDGLMELASKARSMHGAVREIAGILNARYGDTPVAAAVMHAEDEVLAEKMTEALKHKLNVKYVFSQPLTASLVVHGGPGTIAVAVIPYEYVREVL